MVRENMCAEESSQVRHRVDIQDMRNLQRSWDGIRSSWKNTGTNNGTFWELHTTNRIANGIYFRTDGMNTVGDNNVPTKQVLTWFNGTISCQSSGRKRGQQFAHLAVGYGICSSRGKLVFDASILHLQGSAALP